MNVQVVELAENKVQRNGFVQMKVQVFYFTKNSQVLLISIRFLLFDCL